MRGEIWLANLPEIKNTSIQHGIRPVVIWSNADCNQYSPVISIFPITSKNKSYLPTHVDVGLESGLKKDSIILAEQPMSICKSMLINKIGECNKTKMKEIYYALFVQAGLYKLEKPNSNLKLKMAIA